MSRICYGCTSEKGDYKITFAHRLGKTEQFYICEGCYKKMHAMLTNHKEEAIESK